MKSKEWLKEKLEFIKTKADKDNVFNVAFNTYFGIEPECYIETFDTETIEFMINLVEEAMGDTKEQWISYWCFEQNFGTDENKKVFMEDGTITVLRNIDDLYELIKKENEVAFNAEK